MLTGLDATQIRAVLDKHPFNCFPVRIEGKIEGVAMRDELRAALAEKRAPKLQHVAICSPDQTVHEVGDRFLESPAGVIVLADPKTGAVTGIITLHDLLRAQASFLE